jgi:hypothetical protein
LAWMAFRACRAGRAPAVPKVLRDRRVSRCWRSRANAPAFFSFSLTRDRFAGPQGYQGPQGSQGVQVRAACSHRAHCCLFSAHTPPNRALKASRVSRARRARRARRGKSKRKREAANREKCSRFCCSPQGVQGRDGLPALEHRSFIDEVAYVWNRHAVTDDVSCPSGCGEDCVTNGPLDGCGPTCSDNEDWANIKLPRMGKK